MEKIYPIWHERVADFIVSNKRGLVSFIMVAAAVVGLFVFYTSRMETWQADAHKAFVEALELVELPVKGADASGTRGFDSEQEKWEQVAQSFGKVADDFANSVVESAAAGQQARALLMLNKRAEALQAYRRAEYAARTAQIKDFFTLTVSLLELEDGDQQTRVRALDAIRKLAVHPGPARDVAGYRLGEYHFGRGEYRDARDTWKQLIASSRDEQEKTGELASYVKPSVWAMKAEERLDILGG